MSTITDIPEIVVQIDGRRLEMNVMQWLVDVHVRQRLSLPAQAELTFRVPVEMSADALLAEPGNAMSIEVAHGDDLFDGQVTAIEYEYGPSHEQVIRIRGYDLMHQLRKRQSVRSHDEMNLTDLATALVSEMGLHVTSSVAGPNRPKRVQFCQSDFELLAEAADSCGQYFVLRGNTLHLTTLEGAGDIVELTLGIDLLEARVELNAEMSCKSVTTMAWDPSRVELHRAAATRARVGTKVGAKVSSTTFGGTGRRTMADRSVSSKQEAEQLAQGELDRRVASEITLWGVADGDARLRPGTTVSVTGVAHALEGNYVVTTVTHSIDDRKGFVSEFSTPPPPPRQSSTRGPLATWGIVTSVKDPDRLGRVQVKLPTYDDLESCWMGLVTPGAGLGKGMVVMPDRGDNVLVMLANGDPSQGIVIGGLYGTNGPPDDGGIQGSSVQRFTLLTPGGQRVQLNDHNKSIRVENNDGSFLELTPSLARLHAATDLTLDAPGKSVCIRGKAIRFEEA